MLLVPKTVPLGVEWQFQLISRGLSSFLRPNKNSNHFTAVFPSLKHFCGYFCDSSMAISARKSLKIVIAREALVNESLIFITAVINIWMLSSIQVLPNQAVFLFSPLFCTCAFLCESSTCLVFPLLTGQTVFDLASDAAMKQFLEGSLHRVSVQITVGFLKLEWFVFDLFFHVSHLCPLQGMTRHVKKHEGLLWKVKTGDYRLWWAREYTYHSGKSHKQCQISQMFKRTQIICTNC